MLEGKNIIIRGLNIKYYRSAYSNNDNVLVFLHGWGSCAMHFHKTLEKCGNCIAIDLPGFGNSEAPQTAWSLTEYASFVDDFLKKLNIKNPILAGHSFGGSIGIKYCAYKNNIRKLILIGSAGIRKKNVKKYGFLIIAKIFKVVFLLPGLHKIRDTARRYFYKAIDSEDYIDAGVLTDTCRKIINEDLTEDLKKIKTPTILIWGKDDRETSVQDGELMQQLVDGSQLYIISNAGHYVFLDDVDKFNEIFLAQIK